MVTRIPFNGIFRLTQTFGNYRPDLYPSPPHKHKGVDMVGVSSGIIYGTMADGRVEYVGYEKDGFGNYARIIDNATGYKHYFAHMREVYVEVGQRITYTTKIGYQGATGNVTGVHLHYEIRNTRVTPYELINPCTYMGIPNKIGTYNSSDYPVDQPTPDPEPEPDPDPDPEPTPDPDPGPEPPDDSQNIAPWAQSSVERMIETGIMTEYEGKFNPLENVTREAAAVIIDRTIDYIQITNNDFSYAEEQIDLLIEKGILKGNGEGDYNLNFMIYKGDVAALLGRVVQMYDAQINELWQQINELKDLLFYD